jgi:D-serine dehydratase
MLIQQQKIQLSSYSGLYGLIVPKDNLLRKINELIDFSFIYEELLNKYCLNNGRNPELFYVDDKKGFLLFLNISILRVKERFQFQKLH